MSARAIGSFRRRGHRYPRNAACQPRPLHQDKHRAQYRHASRHLLTDELSPDRYHRHPAPGSVSNCWQPRLAIFLDGVSFWVSGYRLRMMSGWAWQCNRVGVRGLGRHHRLLRLPTDAGVRAPQVPLRPAEETILYSMEGGSASPTRPTPQSIVPTTTRPKLMQLPDGR